MPRRISYDKKVEIIDIYRNNPDLTITDIGILSDVSYATAYGVIKIENKENPSTGESFSSISEFMDFRKRDTINPLTGKKFESRTEYMAYFAMQEVNPNTQENFKSLNEYMDYHAQQRINPSTGLNFESYSELRKYQSFIRSQKPESKKLAEIIKTELAKMSQSQAWLARQIGISRSSISKYITGNCIPNEDILEKIFSVLQVEYKTLEDLVN